MYYDKKAKVMNSKYDHLDKGKRVSLKSFMEQVAEITRKDTKNPDAIVMLALFCCLQPEEDDVNEADLTVSFPLDHSFYSVKPEEEEEK